MPKKWYLQNGLHLITNSRINCFNECVRKHYYSYLCLIRRIKTATPLRMGSAAHKADEIFDKSGDSDTAVQEGLADYNQWPSWCNSETDRYDW